MANTTPLAAGDKVIYRKSYGAAPLTDNVDRVTKAGWVKLAQHSAGCYKATWRNEYQPTGIGNKSAERVYPWSQETWDKLVAEADAEAALKAKQAAEREARQAAAEAAGAARMAETRTALGGNVYAAVRYRETLPDGSRLFVLHLPVKADLSAKKGPAEVAMVRIKDSRRYDWRADAERALVEPYFTYASQDTSNFPSCSNNAGYATDEDALWAVADSRYHGW